MGLDLFIYRDFEGVFDKEGVWVGVKFEVDLWKCRSKNKGCGKSKKSHQFKKMS